MPSFLTLLAQDTAGQGSSSPLGSQLPMFLILGVRFYFLVIRPQQRQRKELDKRLAALQKGDEVITTSGIHALVHNVKDKTVVLKVAEGVMIEFDKPAVATVLKKDSTARVESK